MKRSICAILAVLLFLSVFSSSVTVHAAKKAEVKRSIAIVFDNSGSMYIQKKQDWCRATYAMEVFASMLNKGDTLTIYPMHPIEVEGKKYTMEAPFVITDASQSSKIREIYTPNAGGTPIASIDNAAEGLKKSTADKKYMIVLTDGDEFDNKGVAQTKKMLDSRFKGYAGPEMTVMYLGVGKDAVMPTMSESEYFVKKHAKNSEDVLSSLTEMCNMIFGRDSLPKNHLNGRKIDFDVSMSKVIVFVQGENVSNLKLAGSKSSGTLAGSTSTKYSTKGCGKTIEGATKATPDTTLQGMMVTYTNCAVGQYNIEFSGNASRIEVYYEPDVDLDFIFTDSEGNLVDPNELYEGDYKVSFGMKDAKTNQLVQSDLLGSPKYEGTYIINGKETKINHEGLSGEVPVSLKMGDTFEANLTATYLGGYKISKDSTDFGWPKGGIKVAARPAGDLKLKISGGDSSYSLQDLEKGKAFILEAYYQGQKLTGKELEKLELTWDANSSYAELRKEFANDHYKITLSHKDAKSPESTLCGNCKVTINGSYAVEGSEKAKAKATISYKIVDDFVPVKVDLIVAQNYIVISELNESKEIVAKLSLKGKPLSSEEFKSIKLNVDCGGIKYKLTPNEKDSSFSIKLLETTGIAEDKYPIKVTAEYTDHIGRKTESENSVNITLSNTPLWVKWLIRLLLLIVLIIIIWLIMHIKVLPKYVRFTKKESRVLIDGEDVTKFCSFDGSASSAVVKYGGNKIGLSFPSKAGKESYLYKKQTKRYAEVVSPASIKRIGNANIESATIGSIRYVLNDKNQLERTPASKAPLNLKHGMPVVYSGTITSAGVKKSFNINTKFNFKK